MRNFFKRLTKALREFSCWLDNGHAWKYTKNDKEYCPLCERSWK